MHEIILSEPIASGSRLERLNLFPGRHLGEQEFELLQAYADRRIAPLLIGRDPGVIHGLSVGTGRIGALGEGFTVSPGLALAGSGLLLGLFSPLRQTWRTLVDEFLADVGSADAAGVYYLTLKRATRYIDADPHVDPCQRAEFDPLRDARRVVVGTLGLTRLAIDGAGLASASRETIENWVAANNVERELLHAMGDAVPLGVVAIVNVGTVDAPDFQLGWFSEAAGRYPAEPNGGYQVLRNQVKEAFRRTLQEAGNNRGADQTVLDYLNANLRLGFLPAAGELPQELIQNIASQAPGIGWLPSHVYADMVAVPAESVDELIKRHLPRRAIDLRQPSNDRIRLMVAVNEPDYSPHLMRFPATDARLHEDIYRYFQRAYLAWMRWMTVFHRLYYLLDQDLLSPATLKSLDLPEPPAHPVLPQTFFQKVIDQGRDELGEGNPPTAPYPYSQGVPSEPDFYHSWGMPDAGQPVMPPSVVPPEENGLVIQHTLARHELEALDNEIRATRARLEKTRDYLLLQRQQLDNQTVSFAALAGGVAGDGSGLQVARWLPFTQLKAPQDAAEETTDSSRTPTEEAEATDNIATAEAFQYISKAVPQNFQLSSARVPMTEMIQSAPLKQQNFSNTLRKNPTVLSNVQLSLNRSLLDKLASAPKAAVTRPAFETKEFRFGVLEHIRPEVQEYKKAVRGMSELVSTLGNLFDKAETCSIRKTLQSFGKPKPLSALGLEGDHIQKSDRLTSQIYEAMFDAGKILTHQIAHIEGRYARIEALLEGKLRARINKEAQIEKLAALIRKATEELDSVDKPRVEYLGDYGVAQRLLDEDWLNIYKQNQERTRILTTAVTGVYYVRERQTPISMRLADPLELRYCSASDIVPGCDWESDPDLPDELEEFFDTVMEVPMADWPALNQLIRYIPAQPRLQYMANVRQARITAKQKRSQSRKYRSSNLNLSLAHVQTQSYAMLSDWSRYAFPLAVSSVRRRQEEAAKVMSLEDILSSSRGRLKSEAQTLSTRLAQGVYCILEKLNDISPSVRLQWAQLAEDDRLRVDKVELWPGLDRAERDDFNATRTLAELVAWWFRQIDAKASANGRGAMRNMIRATLIHAALGDPTDILQGEVQVPPRFLAQGETLRLRLNRSARPGTALQLLDTSQKLVAMLTVEDDDERGAVAKVTKVAASSATVTTQYKVVANRLTHFVS